jgi:hypothetical protein
VEEDHQVVEAVAVEEEVGSMINPEAENYEEELDILKDIFPVLEIRPH